MNAKVIDDVQKHLDRCAMQGKEDAAVEMFYEWIENIAKRSIGYKPGGRMKVRPTAIHWKALEQRLANV